MANHPSALKRVRQTQKRRLRNKMIRTRVKTAVNQTRQALGESPQTAGGSLIAAQSVIDKAAKKGVLHKRTAARKISRLARSINSAV